MGLCLSLVQHLQAKSNSWSLLLQAEHDLALETTFFLASWIIFLVLYKSPAGTL